MGMFDTVIVRCAYCGGEIQVQTKAGPCMLEIYDLVSAPPQILGALDQQTVECPECLDVGRIYVTCSAQVSWRAPVVPHAKESV